MFFIVPICTSFSYALSHVSIVRGGVDIRFAGLLYFKNALFSDEKFLPYLADVDSVGHNTGQGTMSLAGAGRSPQSLTASAVNAEGVTSSI